MLQQNKKKFQKKKQIEKKKQFRKKKTTDPFHHRDGCNEDE